MVSSAETATGAAGVSRSWQSKATSCLRQDVADGSAEVRSGLGLPVDHQRHRDGGAVGDRLAVGQRRRGVDVESVLGGALDILFAKEIVDRDGPRTDRFGLPVANERDGFGLAFDTAGEQSHGPVGERSRAYGQK